MDNEAIKLGLLMESAQTHEALAKALLEKLQAHTQGLDGVVRDEIRRTLLEQLKALHAESQNTVAALRTEREQIKTRMIIRSVAMMGLSALVMVAIALGVAWYVLPKRSEITQLRTEISQLQTERDELAGVDAELERRGGRADVRRCAEHLCVRVDLRAPRYGDQSDYYVIRGY